MISPTLLHGKYTHLYIIHLNEFREFENCEASWSHQIIRWYTGKQDGNPLLGTQETYQLNKKLKPERCRWLLGSFWIWQDDGVHTNPFHSAHESDAWLWHL